VQTTTEAAPGARPAHTVAELHIRNRLDELARASAWLAQFAEGLALPAETLFRLDLGLTEALDNVVAYAFPDAAEHEIRIRIAAEGDAVRLEVEDDGRAFDPLQAERPPPPRSLEEAPIGGLGIHLIRSMLDECHYRREAGRNRLTLIARPRENDAPGR
jgi:serine/threonine-protein kinase RsbW/sigma-B regulation protein RsbU (phosphoserine phosphatase)